MSFRYTNGLVGMLKHRLQLESTHRDIARRTFTGTCNGVEVTCTGHGRVIAIRLLDPAEDSRYRKPLGTSPVTTSDAAASSAATSPSHATNTHTSGLDLPGLAQSIKAATWAATRRIQQEKEEAHHRSLVHNPQLQARGSLRDWYEQDANSIQPRPFDGLKQEFATPWMQAVRFGKPDSDALLNDESVVQQGPPGGGPVCVLAESDCTPEAIPIGSAHPLYAAGLLHLELDPRADLRPDPTSTAASPLPGSRVKQQTLLSEQRKEMCRDEQLFWERVELIRRGQLAALPGGVKRQYAEMASTVVDNTEEKVSLRFID